MNSKKWLKIFLCLYILLLLLFALSIYIIDPYCHFHNPLNFISYYYDVGIERFVNNGFLRNYNYDAIITGTSFTENFKVSEFNSLFDCNSIKVPLSGAELKELSEQISLATKYNTNLKYVLLGLVYEDMFHDKDKFSYDNIPTYLYDDNWLNDYKYLFSGQAFRRVARNIVFTISGNHTPNFDEYAYWSNLYTYSKESVLSTYNRQELKSDIKNFSIEDRKNILDNINQNLISIIKSNSNITFYLFFTPHSILWWDKVSQSGEISEYLQAEEIIINSLLDFDNVKLYSFFNNFDLICNLNNYKDITHYSEDINSEILRWIKNDEYLITKDNLSEYLESERKFYFNYDYDKIFTTD